MCIAQQHIINGTRISTSKAFLEPIISQRPNLHILTKSHVTRIVFDGLRAKSVQFCRNGIYHNVVATKEIILSAGVINSPQLLLLSGVGPWQHLYEMNIPIVANLPGVGANLHDHIYTIGPAYVASTTGGFKLNPISFSQYMYDQSGLLAHVDIALIHANSSFNTDYNWPDIQIFVTNFGPDEEPTGIVFERTFGILLLQSD